MSEYICAIDQGTTSTRAILFNHNSEIVFASQLEHRQFFPKPGWVEHDASEIWNNTQKVLSDMRKYVQSEKSVIKAIGITNQRETVVAWDWLTGEPLCRAIVWQDQRTSDYINRLIEKYNGINSFRAVTGLPLSPYFSASKMRWMIDNCEEVAQAMKRESLCFGTIDSWIVYKLTGGRNGGYYLTDATNASRTLLMNINTVSWDQNQLDIFGISENNLPEIIDSIPERLYGTTSGDCACGEGIAISGILGDQQAALFGQACFDEGGCKCTYGTGCFLLFNTGEKPVQSENGLITTVAYTRTGCKPVFALEGSVAIAGSLVQWFRDNIGLIRESSEIEKLAAKAEDSGDVYIVPAFAGLFAPYWRSDARGIIAGMTGYTTSSHLARAVLESTAFQTMEILNAMEEDAGGKMNELKVDGGMTVNEMLMQFQSDISEIPVIHPKVRETTALGAAYAAGLSAGFWGTLQELKEYWEEEKSWHPVMGKDTRGQKKQKWKKAVGLTFGWTEKE